MSYSCCAIPLELDAIAHYGNELGLASTEQALYHLAQAIQLHVVWQDLPQGLCIIRAHPTPVLAIISTHSDKSLAQLKLQSSVINSACRRLRYLNYPKVVVFQMCCCLNFQSLFRAIILHHLATRLKHHPQSHHSL